MLADNENPGQWLDIGYVGDITRIEPAVVKALQDDQFIPVISSIGYGEDGTAYNINADVVAGKMADVLGAEKLVMMIHKPGVLDKNGELLRSMSGKTIEQQLEDGRMDEQRRGHTRGRKGR